MVYSGCVVMTDSHTGVPDPQGSVGPRGIKTKKKMGACALIIRTGMFTPPEQINEIMSACAQQLVFVAFLCRFLYVILTFSDNSSFWLIHQ